MKDLVIRNTGNSRFLKSNTTAATWEEAKGLLQVGLFPVDFAGLNEEGVDEHGTALNKENLLSDETATALGLNAEATPDDAFEVLARPVITVNGTKKKLTMTWDGTTLAIVSGDI